MGRAGRIVDEYLSGECILNIQRGRTNIRISNSEENSFAHLSKFPSQTLSKRIIPRLRSSTSELEHRETGVGAPRWYSTALLGVVFRIVVKDVNRAQFLRKKDVTPLTSFFLRRT